MIVTVLDNFNNEKVIECVRIKLQMVSGEMFMFCMEVKDSKLNNAYNLVCYKKVEINENVQV
jgi:hypothetical protein